MKLKKIFLSTFLIVFLVSLTSTSAEASRGKWKISIGANPAGGSTITLDCRYSLFVKDCNVGDQLILQGSGSEN